MTVILDVNPQAKRIENEMTPVDPMTLSRPQRLMLKRAWASSLGRPLQVMGPGMQRVAKEMIDLELIETVPPHEFAVLLTRRGFHAAGILQKAGWPYCEKPPMRSAPSSKNAHPKDRNDPHGRR